MDSTRPNIYAWCRHCGGWRGGVSFRHVTGYRCEDCERFLIEAPYVRPEALEEDEPSACIVELDAMEAYCSRCKRMRPQNSLFRTVCSGQELHRVEFTCDRCGFPALASVVRLRIWTKGA